MTGQHCLGKWDSICKALSLVWITIFQSWTSGKSRIGYSIESGSFHLYRRAIAILLSG